MGRPKKIAEKEQPIKLPQENMLDSMVAGSLNRYEKVMLEFIPTMQRLIERIDSLIANRPTIPISVKVDKPMLLTTPFQVGGPVPLTGDLSDKQIWYFSNGPGSNMPSDFIKRNCNKEKWQDLTKSEAIKLIGDWKQIGEKSP